MKGVYSNPFSSVGYQIGKALIPDTPFSFESGGLPDKIATLTFEQIKEAHTKYYHPQNSVIYLYGDLDYKKRLSTIDKNFLSHFSKTENFKSPAIPLQKDFNYKTPLVESTYPGKSGPNKDYLVKSYILGNQLSKDEDSAATVLMQAFIENNAAPMKLRALKEGIAKSTYSSGFGGQDNGLALIFEGASVNNRERIEKILNEELLKVATNGLDPELLNSILNRYEFAFKEKNSNGSHKGMQLGSIVLNNWIYKDRPLAEALDFVVQFKRIRSLLKDQDYIKSFFKKHFIENKKVRWVTLKPDPDFSKKFNAGLSKQVEKALKEKTLEEYEQEDVIYKKWVASKESQDILSKTPTLELKDIKADEKAIPFEKIKKGKRELILYPQETSGIAYLNLFFDLKGVTQENLKNLDLFTSLLKRTNTKNRDFKNLSKQIGTFVGGLSFSTSAFQSSKNPENFRPTLGVSLRFIKENQNKAMDLLKEVIISSQFTPEDRVNNLLEEIKTSMASGVSYRAPGLSMGAVTRNFYPQQGGFADLTGGGSFENYMLNNTPNATSLTPQLLKLLKNIFNQDRLYLTAVTASKKDLSSLTQSIDNLYNSLPKGESKNQEWSFDQKSYDAYSIPGEVQYVSQASSFRKNIPYTGTMLVYAKYLNNNYMTPKLREQAGAYGGGAAFSRNGIFRMSTYRDPNLAKSFKIFSEAIGFMENEKFDAEKLKPAILGSLKTYYKDKSLYSKTSSMTYLYLTDQTWDDYLKIKQQILSTTPEDINKISQALKPTLAQSKKAVAGNADKIKKEAPFLKNVLSLQ